MSVQEKLQNVFRDVFDDDSIEIYPEMTANDLEDWDSLNHLRLVAEAEKAFSTRFTTGEILKLKNVGDLIKLIEVKS
jgi:acyl carrier protein